MSEKVIYDLLLRASSDPDFKQEMEKDPASALKRLGIALSPEEKEELDRALKQEDTKTTFGLDQRLSQSGVSISPQVMLRQKGRTNTRNSEYDEWEKEYRHRLNIDSKQKIEEEKEQAMEDEIDYEVERG